MATQTSKPALRWGIIGPGRIASWFASDLQLQRTDTQASHTIVAIGSSSYEKGNAFVAQHCGSQAVPPVVYNSHAALYADTNVDIVYISTPHALHKRCTLDAIAAGKHVLCEKPMAVNALEAEEMIAAAKKQGVFLMEGVWTRFFPLTQKIQELVHTDKIIGKVARVWCDFGIKFDLSKIPSSSRMRDPNLGAGATLDIGIYSLMWGTLLLEPKLASAAPEASIVASGVLQGGIDVSTAMILSFEGSDAQGILTCSMLARTGNVFATVEGEKGTISISGPSAGSPNKCVIKLENGEEKVVEVEKVGFGFHYEADAVALDIAAGKTESETMPLMETLRSMKLLDDVRRQIGLKYPQDN